MFKKIFTAIAGFGSLAIAVYMGLGLSALVTGLGAVNSYAAVNLPTSVNVTDVETMVGVVLTGLAVMWGVRKLIKTVNRS